MTNKAVLFTRKMIRPQLQETKVRQLVERQYGFKPLQIQELNSYFDQNFLVKVSVKHSNPHIEDVWPHGYVFKALNSEDSGTSSHVGMYICNFKSSKSV